MWSKWTFEKMDTKLSLLRYFRFSGIQNAADTFKWTLENFGNWIWFKKLDKCDVIWWCLELQVVGQSSPGLRAISEKLLFFYKKIIPEYKVIH